MKRREYFSDPLNRIYIINRNIFKTKINSNSKLNLGESSRHCYQSNYRQTTRDISKGPLVTFGYLYRYSTK